MIGGALIPDKSGNRVHQMYLNLLRVTKKYIHVTKKLYYNFLKFFYFSLSIYIS